MIAKFNGIRDLVQAEKHCKRMDINVKVIPTPPELNPECGMSLMIDDDDIDKFSELMVDIDITYGQVSK